MKAPHLSGPYSQSRKVLVLTALVAATSGVCNAQFIVNGDFSGSGTGGFAPGWAPTTGGTIGDAAVVVPSFNGGSFPTSGFPFAGAVSTILSSDAPTISGTSSAVLVSTLESFLSLASNTLSQQGKGAVVEGSAFKQTFTAAAGDKITFKWDFYTAENTVTPAGRDYGFYTLQFNSGSPTVAVLADPKSGLHNAPGGGGTSTFFSETGFQTSSTITIPVAGTWTLGFGVADTSTNPGQDSALAITGITFTPVPEPWAWSLMSALVLGAFAVTRRVRAA